jgi:hypothetical protein
MDENICEMDAKHAQKGEFGAKTRLCPAAVFACLDKGACVLMVPANSQPGS